MSAKSAAKKLDAATRVCVLKGAERVLQRQHLDSLAVALEEAHGQVERITLEGDSAGLADVLDELRSYGLMQQYKLVVVNDAQGFVTTHRQALERYVAEPVDHGTLVLCCDTWRASKLDKLIGKVGCLVECKPLTAAGAAKWLIGRAKTTHKRSLTPQGAGAMVDRLGCDLALLDSNLAKLALIAGEGAPLDGPLVEQVCGRSSEEQAWVVQEAVLQAFSGNAGPAITKVHELVELARQPEVMVSYFVVDLVRKLVLATGMKKQGVPEQQIAGELKLWGPRRATFMSALRKLDGPAAGRLLNSLLAGDVAAKTGRGTIAGNLECFCAALADEFSGPSRQPQAAFARGR